MMFSRLIIDGNAVYEIDEECMKKKQGKTPEKESGKSNRLGWQEKPSGSGS